MKKIMSFDARQEMGAQDFEIQHKRDSSLRDVGLHHHDFYEIFYLLSGDVTYIVEGHRYKLIPGDLLLISPKELHQVSIRTDVAPYERFVLWLDEIYLQALCAGEPALKQVLDPAWPDYKNLLRLTQAQQNAVCAQMEAIFQESDTQLFGTELEKRSLITHLLITLNRIVRQGAPEEQMSEGSSRIVAELVSYVNVHYCEKLTLDTLAEHFYMSKYHMSHEFQKHMGIGICHYIQKKRLQIAKRRLSQGEKPKEVSALCGFGDYPGFYRAFLKEYGIAPRDYYNSACANTIARKRAAGTLCDIE